MPRGEELAGMLSGDERMGTDAEGKTAGKAHIRKAMPGRLLRGTLVAVGTFFLALGFIGIFIPLLPTTPFLLLAAACYARGSQRFYNWLLANRLFGSYIRDYREGRGIPVRAKAQAIALIWLTIFISSWFFVTNIYMRMVLVVIAAGVTVHLLTIKTQARQGPQ